MAMKRPIPAALLATLIVAASAAACGAALAGGLALEKAPMQTIRVAASDVGSRSLLLGVGKSVVIDLPRDIKDVLVADPKIANAIVRSSRRAYIIGAASGATNIFFFDAAGKQIAGFDIKVGARAKNRDVSFIQRAINQFIPGAQVEVHSVGDGIILTGSVASQLEAQQAYDIASHFVDTGESFVGGGGGGGGPGGTVNVGGNGSGLSTAIAMGSSSTSGGAGSQKVVNLIVVRGRDQVMLKVTVAEMDRSVIKQLGINLSGSLGYGAAVVNFNNATAGGNSAPVFPVNGTPSNSIVASLKGVSATLQAMEQAGVIRTLAEPTLTAISGESAHFLAGGSFPYPSITSCTTTPCPPVISFQNYGVGLSFTPVVLAEGRISLHVATEVSQLDPANSVTVAGTTVPGLSVRRADTTAEIPSGGSLAIAGMLENQTKQTITGFPGLMEVPIIGTLFKSRDYLNNQTELVVLVTPYIVHAVARKDLSRPDDGFADPSDPASVLLGRLNRIYGVGGIPDVSDTYHGNYGFILD